MINVIPIVICSIIEVILGSILIHIMRGFEWRGDTQLTCICFTICFCIIFLILFLVSAYLNYMHYIFTTELGTYSELNVPEAVETYYKIKTICEVDYIFISLLTSNIATGICIPIALNLRNDI